MKKDALTKLVFGLTPDSIAWADVDYVYSTSNVYEHWILVMLDINLGKGILYDSYPTYVS